MSNRTAPSELWELAKSLVRSLYSIYGQPQEIAAQGALDLKTYTWLIVWLHACETLLRRLLLIEARTLGAPAPSPARGKSARPEARKPAPFSLNPDDWRVSFRISGPLGPRASGAHVPAENAGGTPAVPGAQQQHFHPAIPLAFRAEALYRVCKNPLPYARRLARSLARASHTIARILAPPHVRKRKSGDPPNVIDIIGHEAWAQIDLALPAPNTS